MKPMFKVDIRWCCNLCWKGRDRAQSFVLKFTLQLNILTGTFLLASRSKTFQTLLLFVQGQGQNANKNIQQRSFSGFITIPPLLTLIIFFVFLFVCLFCIFFYILHLLVGLICFGQKSTIKLLNKVIIPINYPNLMNCFRPMQAILTQF